MSQKIRPADLLIVGSGIMGSITAELVRRQHPNARIVMVDGGRTIGEIRGQHLHDSPDDALREEYMGKASYGIQSAYMGAKVSPFIGDSVRGIRPGMYNLSAFGAEATTMSASAMAWNAGGMGVHWTAATPWPWGVESFPWDGDARWKAELQEAESALGVHPAPFPPHDAGKKVLSVLEKIFGEASAPGRHVQAMPMAVIPTEEYPMPRIGPNRIFARMTEPNGQDFELIEGTLAIRLSHDGQRVKGAWVQEVETGEEYLISAGSVVVAADTLRTPQLLFASEIHSPALGKFLNEHAMLSGRVLVDLERFGLSLESIPVAKPGEWMTGSFWLPHSGSSQPFHGQISDHTYIAESGEKLAYALGLSFYVPTEIREENEVVFDPDRTDASGLPRMTLRMSHSAQDEKLIENARELQQQVGDALGAFDPDRDGTLLPPGSSLHFTGTTRAGRRNDGSSVTDPHGKVWGFENLWLAGGSVVPTAVVANSTLTAAVTAVRAARSVSATLRDNAETATTAMAR